LCSVFSLSFSAGRASLVGYALPSIDAWRAKSEACGAPVILLQTVTVFKMPVIEVCRDGKLVLSTASGASSRQAHLNGC
jgi:hypothetical protein